MAASGEKLVATATAFARNDTAGTTTSTGYTGTLATAGSCGTAFVAPPSGKVTIHSQVSAYASATNLEVKTAFWVGTGSSVGSGTEVYAANDNDQSMVQTGGGTATNVASMAGWAEVSGLTPGNTYNCQLRHRVNGGIGTWLYRKIKVIPDV
jgi:hypothetical protein